MEFPETGERCSVGNCKQLDFLPVICNYCQSVFCKDHFHASSHTCGKHQDNVASTKTKSSSYTCTMESCTETFPIEMPCVKCKKHYCVQHRYHGCLEITDDEKATKLKKWQIPKKQFADAKAIVDQELSNNFKKSKNVAMANKVRLMKLKGSAIGPKKLPMEERCYFLVYPPINPMNNSAKSSKGIYVSMNWSIGKSVDFMADAFKIHNPNGSATETVKLRLFDYETGTLIAKEMDETFKSLLQPTLLIDGQSIILEYSNEDSVDVSLYK